MGREGQRTWCGKVEGLSQPIWKEGQHSLCGRVQGLSPPMGWEGLWGSLCLSGHNSVRHLSAQPASKALFQSFTAQHRRGTKENCGRPPNCARRGRGRHLGLADSWRPASAGDGVLSHLPQRSGVAQATCRKAVVWVKPPAARQRCTARATCSQAAAYCSSHLPQERSALLPIYSWDT